MKRTFALLAALSLAGCSDSPSAPLPCQAHQTSDLTLVNGRSLTLEWIVDGGRVASLAPGASTIVALPAGRHEVFPVFANSGGVLACTAVYPILVACSGATISCN